MAIYEYRTVVIHHAARELSITDGTAPQAVPNAYFSPTAVFNELGAEGWKLVTSVHEQLEIGNFTMHNFCRELS